MIDASSAQVWTALITVGGGIATLIVQGYFASRTREKLITKVEQVHTLANSTATAGIAREATQAAVIRELRAAGAIAQTDKAVAAALAGPGNHAAPLHSSSLTGSEASAAIAVAEAAVEKKDEIVDRTKK